MSSRAARSLTLATILLILLTGVGGTVYLWNELPPTSGLLGGGWTAASPYHGPGDLPSAIRSASLEGISVAVIDDRRNERITAPGFYAEEVGLWSDALRELGADIAGPYRADVLVLPHSLCLGASMRGLILSHLERGGGLVTTGALGAYDGDCRPLADTLLTDLAGGGPGAIAKLAPPDSGSYYAVALGETPIAAGIPSGARLEIRPASQLVFRGAGREIYYSDFRRVPSAHDDERYFDGAVVRSTVGPGRVTAFGFAMVELVPGWSARLARPLMANAVIWAAGRPHAQLATWPDGARAGVSFAQGIGEQFNNAARVKDMFARDSVPLTSFVVGNAAEEHIPLTRRLAERDEVGSYTADHRPLDGLSRESQARQLAWAQRQLTAIIGHPATGLRPPEERFDYQTLQAWRDVGGEYVFASNNARTTAPEIIPLGADSMVILSRSTHDDFQFLSVEMIRDRGKLLDRFLEDLERIVQYRGLYLASFHSHLLADAELLPTLKALLDAARADSTLWIAGASEIADWWRQRAAIEVRARLVPPAYAPAEGEAVRAVRAAGAGGATGVGEAAGVGEATGAGEAAGVGEGTGAEAEDGAGLPRVEGGAGLPGVELEVVNTGQETFRRGVVLVDMPDGGQRRVALGDLAPGERRILSLD